MPRRAPRLPDGIVGVTCHDSRHLAMEAGEAGADYVAFGAFFPTPTKEPKTDADIELLRWWAEAMVVPVVAIGGITVANAPALIEAGADFLAVAAGVWEHADGPEAAVREFNALFAAREGKDCSAFCFSAFCWRWPITRASSWPTGISFPPRASTRPIGMCRCWRFPALLLAALGLAAGIFPPGGLGGCRRPWRSWPPSPS